MRDALGLDPYDNAAADRPMVLTATGFVPIEANAGGEGRNAGPGTANGKMQFVKPALGKASVDDPEHPGWPAGTSGGRGGKFRPKDGAAASQGDGMSSVNSSDAVNSGPEAPKRYAVRDTATLTDGPRPQESGRRYAAGPEEDDEPSVRLRGTPARGAEGEDAGLQAARIAWQMAASRVRRIIPGWNPSPVLTDPTTTEGQIAEYQAWTEEAQQLLGRLPKLGFPRDPVTGRRIPSPTDAETGSPIIDRTTQKLMSVLDEVVRKVGPRPDLTASDYGTEVHTKFAETLRAMRLPGIEVEDVERTFSLTKENFYGAKDSIRTDVILRDDDGKILAVYDPKTGYKGLSEARVIRIRFVTESDHTVPLIELSRSRGAILKFR
jgi:hypothetical protein